VPPVVLANRAESYIVDDGVTGIVAANEKEYARAIEMLYKDSLLRRKLSNKAREAANKRFSLESMIEQWENIFKEVLAFPKSPRKWLGKYSGKNTLPFQIFLESLGEYGKDFRKLAESSYLWRSNTHGTPQHYHYFFPNDKYLSSLCPKIH